MTTKKLIWYMRYLTAGIYDAYRCRNMFTAQSLQWEWRGNRGKLVGNHHINFVQDDYTGLFSLVNASNNYFLVGAALTPNKYFSPISGSHSCKSITWCKNFIRVSIFGVSFQISMFTFCEVSYALCNDFSHIMSFYKFISLQGC